MPQEILSGLGDIRGRGGDVAKLCELASDKSLSRQLTESLKDLGFDRLGDRVRLGHILRAAGGSGPTPSSVTSDLCADGGLLKCVTREGSGPTPNLPCRAKVRPPLTTTRPASSRPPPLPITPPANTRNHWVASCTLLCTSGAFCREISQ